MSTQGDVNCENGLTVALAAPLALGVGVGMLAGEGILWSYNQACILFEKQRQKYAKAVLAANASNSATQQMKSLFARSIQASSQIAATQTKQQTIDTTGPTPAQPEVLRQIHARVRAVLTDDGASLPSVQEIERANLLLQLTHAIERDRALLPPHVITRAEAARTGSLHEIRQTIIMLAEAYQQVETPESRLARQEWEARHTLRVLKTQLQALDYTLSQTESTGQPEFIERRSTLKALIDTAQSSLHTEPAKAQQFLEEAQRVAHVLTETVSAFLFDAWADIHSQVSEQMGMLDTLKHTVEDAKALKMAQETHLHELTQRITSAYNEAEALGQSTSIRVAQRLSLLATRIEFLKEDIFALIGAYQQQTIAETIATTLGTFGFQAVGGQAPTVQTIGDTMRIRAMRTEQTPEGINDEKLITFELSRRGDISYDFSGYTDETCVREAEKVFEALHLAGVYLLDAHRVNDLLKANPKGISKQTLYGLRHQPKANKSQMELAKRIQAVLEHMNFKHIEQSSVGGCIELDAFNGPLGYHVFLPSEGTFDVFRNAEHIDASTDPSDPIVVEAHNVLMERERQTEEAEIAQADEPGGADKPGRKRKSYREQHKKQSLGH